MVAEEIKRTPEGIPITPYTSDAQGLKFDPNFPAEKRYAGDNGCQACDGWPWWARFATGIYLGLNFAVYWGLAVFLQGFVWRTWLCPYLRPWYQKMDRNPTLRNFAEKYIYNKPIHADYFAQALLCLISWLPVFIYMFYAQVTQGTLHYWQIYLYNFSWVGLRGGVLGGVYSITHREGHSRNFYKPWIQKYIGNIFEEHLSPFFGSVPLNFSLTHNYLHHALQARSADSFYQYDVDRSSLMDFPILLHRIFMHCTGLTAYNQMRIHGLHKQADAFRIGLLKYYFVYPAVMLAITRSWRFLFYMYFQPLVGMAFFLCFMNVAFHAMVDYDTDGNPLEVVFSTELTEGDDDYFGEDSHLSHHIQGHVYWRDLPDQRVKLLEEFKTNHATVFRGLSVAEAAGLMLIKKWDVLADHFVQYNTEPAPNKLPEEELIRLSKEDLSSGVQQSCWVGTGLLTKREVAAMLESRCKRREPKWNRASLLVNESASTSFETPI